MPPTRVLLADSQPIFLEGLQTYTDQTADLSVVATATTGADAISHAIEHRPDVAVLDIRLPRTNGIAVARKIREDAPGVGVLMVASYDQEENLCSAMAAGAAGYVTKHAEPQDILTAIRAVAHGGLIINAAITPRIRRRLGTAASAEAFPQLTAREREVLQQLATDHGINAIASRLGITKKTVLNHVSNILAKLPANSRADAVRIARESRL
ncbi:MAG: response regulator transcription factor [Kibdelosporangium sp.]